MSSHPAWLERTFLYTFGLSGLVLLIHTTSVWRQGGSLLLLLLLLILLLLLLLLLLILLLLLTTHPGLPNHPSNSSPALVWTS